MPYFIARPIMWLALHLAFWYNGGLRVEGRENVPRRGGVLITPNHISDADGPAVALALPRPCYLIAKEDLFERGLLSKIILWLHAFPIHRNTADRAALRRTEALLKRGECVVIFPEGTLSPDGKLLPLLPGALLVAQRAGVPVVPAIVEGTAAMVPYGETRVRRAGQPATVRFGPAVTVADLIGTGKGSHGLRAGTQRLADLLLALQQRRPYPSLEGSPLGLDPMVPQTGQE